MSEEAEEREACPRCGESTSVAASLCPFCRSPLLVSVVLDAPIPYADDRSRVAQKLAALGPPFPEKAALLRELARARPVAGRLLTRRAAWRLSALLAAEKLPSELHSGAPASSSWNTGDSRSGLIAGAAAAALAVVALLAWLYLRPRPLGSVEAIAKLATPGTLTLKCEGSVGTGFFVTPRQLLTNAHVVCDGDSVTAATSDGKTFEAKVVKRDRDLDLALLETVTFEGRPLAIGDATALQAGQQLVMIGAPLGLSHTVHSVRVSNTKQALRGFSYLQIEGNVNPGNSGGPLVDGNGRAVGVVTLKLQSADGIGLAIPINYATAHSAFIADPAPKDWRALARFDEAVRAARREDEAEVDRIRNAFAAPGLAELAKGRIGELVAIVVLRAGLKPEPRMLTFSVKRAGEALCEVRRRVGFARASEMGLDDSPFLLWLERHGLANDLFVGVTPLEGPGCKGFDKLIGAEVTLEGADASAARLKVHRSELQPKP